MHFNSADVDLSLWSPRWLFASALTSHAKTPLCSHDIASTATVSPRYCSNETERVIGWRHGSRPLTPMVVVIAGGSLQQGRLWTSQSFCCWKTFTAGLKSDRNYGFWPFSLDSARFLLFSFFVDRSRRFMSQTSLLRPLAYATASIGLPTYSPTTRGIFL